MNDKVFEILGDREIVDNIHSLLNESSKLKNEIFKSVIMMKDFDKTAVQTYLACVNSFLKFWEEYANSLKESMDNSKGAVNIRCIPYENIKEYVYAKNDYASILQFTDGIIKGIESGKFEDPSDISDFFDHTISKAFNGREESVGAVLDGVISFGQGDSYTVSDSNESSKYDIVRKYNLFDRRDRAEIYKAIDKTVNFLLYDVNKNGFTRTKDMKLFVSLINNVVEYINYLLTIYGTRIFVISRYAYPFITNREEAVRVNSDAINESTDLDGSVFNSPIDIMNKLDETLCRDFSKYEKFVDSMDEFIKALGIEPLFGSNVNRRYAYNRLSDKVCMSNMFASKLIGNQLFLFFNEEKHWQYFDGNNNAGAAELNHLVKSLIFNSTQGIQGSSSPKQEMLYVIRETKPESDTIEKWKELARDLSIFGCNMLYNVKDNIERFMRWSSEQNLYGYFTNEALANVNEATKIIGEFYRDIATAFLYRLRDIEMKINDIKNAKDDKTFSSFQINIPGIDKNDHCSNNNNMPSVPDTTRMPIELLDIYAKPTYEYLQMLDECTIFEYGLQDDPYYAVGYYSEAISISQIVNTIISKLLAAKKKFDVFFNNKQFEAAYKWVKAHQGELNQMQYNGSMSVLPYMKDLKINHIEKMITLINGFSEKDVENEEAVNKFVNSLYTIGDKNIADLFDTSKFDANTAGTLYTNFVLFNKDPLNKNDLNVNPITLDSSDKIKQQLEIWVGNVANADTTHKGLLSTSDKIQTATNSLKAKVVSIQNNISNSNTQAPPLGDDNKDDSKTQAPGNQSQQQEQKPVIGDGKQGMLDKLLLSISVATDKMWSGLYYPITKALKDQYQYIKEAYSLGRK